MKKHTMIAAAILTAAAYTGAMAQALSTSEHKVNKAMVNLVIALRSENQGLTESAIKQMAQIGILYPGCTVGEAREVVDSLMVHAGTPSVRYKAYLASNVFDNPAWFAGSVNVYSEKEFFESVETQLHQRIYSSRTD
ncbi:MAG TPA: hypothetical protein VMF88_04135 [Bacteroidota bacterium]|nr:hypothetical protein [Bacteroidota bacterium]